LKLNSLGEFKKGEFGYKHQHTRLGEKERSVYAAGWADAHAAAA